MEIETEEATPSEATRPPTTKPAPLTSLLSTTISSVPPKSIVFMPREGTALAAAAAAAALTPERWMAPLCAIEPHLAANLLSILKRVLRSRL